MGQGEADLRSKGGVSPTCMETSVVSDFVIIQGDWFIYLLGGFTYSLLPSLPPLASAWERSALERGLGGKMPLSEKNALGPSTRFTAGNRLLRILQKVQSQTLERLVGGSTTFLGCL